MISKPRIYQIVAYLIFGFVSWASCIIVVIICPFCGCLLCMPCLVAGLAFWVVLIPYHVFKAVIEIIGSKNNEDKQIKVVPANSGEFEKTDVFRESCDEETDIKLLENNGNNESDTKKKKNRKPVVVTVKKILDTPESPIEGSSELVFPSNTDNFNSNNISVIEEKSTKKNITIRDDYDKIEKFNAEMIMENENRISIKDDYDEIMKIEKQEFHTKIAMEEDYENIKKMISNIDENLTDTDESDESDEESAMIRGEGESSLKVVPKIVPNEDVVRIEDMDSQRPVFLDTPPEFIGDEEKLLDRIIEDIQVEELS